MNVIKTPVQAGWKGRNISYYYYNNTENEIFKGNYKMALQDVVRRKQYWFFFPSPPNHGGRHLFRPPENISLVLHAYEHAQTFSFSLFRPLVS